MQALQSLEQFEMEILSLLNKIKALDSLYFGGGTMLRLCHNLNRYSTDLDFWAKPDVNTGQLFQKIHSSFSSQYAIRDSMEKHYTLLFEIQSAQYPRKLKIEIRKNQDQFEWERKIAFSRFSNIQVMVKGLTLSQMMSNKIRAFLSRKLIRDCFDIEFLLFRGAPLEVDKNRSQDMMNLIDNFKDRDYKVTLGSLLESETREFCIQNRFSFLREELEKNLRIENL